MNKLEELQQEYAEISKPFYENDNLIMDQDTFFEMDRLEKEIRELKKSQ